MQTGEGDRAADRSAELVLPVSGAWRKGDPVGRRRFASVSDSRPFQLEGGGSLPEVEVAFETWGTLAPDRSNAVLVCHALTGDSHVVGRLEPGHPTPGWWEGVVGPGRAVDTDRFFVVGANVLGGCQGTTGPASIDPHTGEPYGSRFPVVTIRDMVRVQARLADQLGISRWHLVAGGSMGGMQALEWSVMYPDRVGATAVLSTTAAASAQQIAWSMVGRQAVINDPGFSGGDYYGRKPGMGPHRGLALARAVAQVTYRSEEVYAQRFGRDLIDPLDVFNLDLRFDVESYLDYHGRKLVRRFDANSYLRLNRAMDLHDLARGRGGLDRALARIGGPVLVASVWSDALYPPYQQEELAAGLARVGGEVDYVEIDSPHGHDGFLIETAAVDRAVRRFLGRLGSS